VLIAVYLTHPTISCWQITSEQVARLCRSLPDDTITHCATETEFLQALPRAEGVLTWEFGRQRLKQAPELRWIATPAAGHEWIDIGSDTTIGVFHGSYHGELIGETVLAMMLAQARGVLKASCLQTLQQWPRVALGQHSRPLRGSHVVIVGFGNIGRWIARLAKPFGVRLTGVRRRATKDPAEKLDGAERIVPVTELDRVLPLADHLVVCLPKTAETDHLIDARRLSLLPRTACVYNVGRGNAIDENALTELLRTGRIAGAGLDVFEEEPLAKDSPLRRLPNVLVMPHAAALSPNYLDLFLDEFIERIRSGSLANDATR